MQEPYLWTVARSGWLQKLLQVKMEKYNYLGIVKHQKVCKGVDFDEENVHVVEIVTWKFRHYDLARGKGADQGFTTVITGR